MNRIVKTVCPLPARVMSMCETGCIYREPEFKHMRCPKATNVSPCAAPCPPNICDCKHLVKINLPFVKNLELSLQ